MKYFSFIALFLFMGLMPALSFAQEAEVVAAIAESTKDIHVTDAPKLVAMIVAGVVTVASIVANLVGKTNIIGKIIHFLAVNIKVG